MERKNTIDFAFANGQRVKDKVSGMTGIIDACSLWLNGCRRYSVQPPMKEGETEKPGSWWVDEDQLIFVDEGIREEQEQFEQRKGPGGPSTKSCNDKF